jgi:hypothetical protein
VFRNEPITLFRPPGEGKHGKEYGPLISVFVFLPLLAIVAALQIPVLLVAIPWERCKHRRFVARMKAQNRVMVWSDFVRALDEKRGTLIIEGSAYKSQVWWWSEEDVRGVSPHQCPTGTLADARKKQRGFVPFRKWCYERYTNPANGRAFLVLEEGNSKLDLMEKHPYASAIVVRPPSHHESRASDRSRDGQAGLRG